MIEHSLSFIEVIPDQTSFDSWKEVLLNTGGTQSTLQDIKITERADGFCYESPYQSQPQYYTRNRFIYWKICHDVLELVEQSLDINLYANKIRYKFLDTPILDGISIHETNENVIILVPTVCSVHRLTFPHPRKLHRQDEFLGASRDLKYPSIFSEASSAESKNSYTFYVFATPKSIDTQIPHVACSTLGPDQEGIYLLAYPSGDILLVCHLSDGESCTYELKTESIVPRILTGWAERFRTKPQDYKSVVNISVHRFGSETYGLTLCREGNLKFWSISKRQCVAAINIFNDLGDRNQINQGSQNFVFRKAVDSDDIDCIFGIFVNFANESKFLILKPVITEDNIQIIRLNTIHSPERDLIDFSLSTSRVWSIWRTETGSCTVYSACLTSESYDTNIWVPVVLENLPDDDHAISAEGDPRQVYLQHIFYPGRFPLNVINKALNIYKKSSTASEANISASTLKQSICLAVENEIRSELKEAEVSDEDYLECANWCWQRFYSCCLQYYVAGLKPLGLLLLPSVSGAVLLKKSSFSFLRPMDPLEYMFLCNDYMIKGQFLCNNLVSEDVDVVENIMKMVGVIVYLEQQVSENFDYTFEKELSYLRPPNIVIAELIEKIQVEMDSEFSDEISKRLSQCSQLYQTIHKILELIRFDIDTLEKPSYLVSNSLRLFFSSQLCTSVITKCIQQQAKIRFTICRNLLLICNILLKMKAIEWNVLEAIRSVCTPELVIFTQVNFVVLWLSSLPALPFFPQQSSIQKVSPLKSNQSLHISRNMLYPVSLLELFIDSVSKHELAKVPFRGDEEIMNAGHWHLSLLPFINHLFRVIWPISNSTLLPEWLLANNQHLWLQQYVRLLTNWCEWNSSARCFLLGISLLTCGEQYKATECFQFAVKGLFTDEFFFQKLLKVNGNETQSEIYIKYYLKVIKLLEFHNARDFVIKVSNTALTRVNHNDMSAATLYSIKFKHQLELKHYEMAYDSLNANPDPERKKDNLRDLVKKLLDEKRFDTLMKFTYGNLEELFCNILFTRARATDAIGNIYYDFLYSYHIKRGAGFFRLAAGVMYEQAIRLDQSSTIEGLEKQVKCLLAANNILSLCAAKYAWVAKPTPEPTPTQTILIPPLAGSNKEPTRLKLSKTVEVAPLDKINKEMELMCAKLKLVKFDQKYFQPETEPNELVIMLSSAGLFKDALRIATIYESSMVPIFELLTKQCILLTEKDDMNSCIWLVENDFQDLSVKRNTAGIAWKLLEEYLHQYEKENESVLHYAIGKKMLSLQTNIPYWFLASYKKRNAPELLSLFIYHGRLQEGIDLTKEYLLAVMGYGREIYGLKYPLLATSPVFAFPVDLVDSLIYEAKQQAEIDPDCPIIRNTEGLEKLFTEYLKTTVRLSNEKCRLQLPLHA